jgi:hypothetical protein
VYASTTPAGQSNERLLTGSITPDALVDASIHDVRCSFAMTDGSDPHAGAARAGTVPLASCLPRSACAMLLERWQRLAPGAWLGQANALARERHLTSAGGAAIQFEFAAAGVAARDYERRIHDEGRVGCRIEGTGMEHDRRNAAVWLTLPATKAALNRLHCEPPGQGVPARARALAMREAQPIPGSGRTRRRDLATLIDESGLAWVSTDAGCDALLRARAWRALFVDRREVVRRAIMPIVIGHGLLGKLEHPYRALTAQVLIVVRPDGPDRPAPPGCATRAVPASATEAFPASATDAFPAAATEAVPPAIDLLIAAAVAAAAALTEGATVMHDAAGMNGPVVGAVAPAADQARRWPLTPLPVLALPGWCPQNLDPGFYDDATVFRSGTGRPRRA